MKNKEITRRAVLGALGAAPLAGLLGTRSQVDDERADEYAFVLWRAGVAGFQPTA